MQREHENCKYPPRETLGTQSILEDQPYPMNDNPNLLHVLNNRTILRTFLHTAPVFTCHFSILLFKLILSYLT